MAKTKSVLNEQIQKATKMLKASKKQKVIIKTSFMATIVAIKAGNPKPKIEKVLLCRLGAGRSLTLESVTAEGGLHFQVSGMTEMNAGDERKIVFEAGFEDIEKKLMFKEIRHKSKK